MLALVMLLMVGGTLHQLLLGTSRTSRKQSEQIALQSTVRGAALVASNELKGLSSIQAGSVGGNDLITLGSHAVSYRAMRGFGYTCDASATGILRLSRAGFSGHRDPQAGRDSALVYAPGVPTPADSDWVPVAVTSVSTAGTCPGGKAAITLAASSSMSLGTLTPGTPVRIYEPAELALYQSEAKSWLGMRSLTSGEAIQPLFGPLAQSEGFRLEYADAAGLATTDPGAVKSITISIRGLAGVSASSPDTGMTEELITQVVLRNAVY
jgi:hypothetical protein